MKYIFSISSGSEPHLYNHTRDIIHAFTHGGRGFRIRIDAMLGYVAAFKRVRILRPSWFLNWLLFQSRTAQTGCWIVRPPAAGSEQLEIKVSSIPCCGIPRLPSFFRNLYRSFKPYPPHLIVPHPAPFHSIQYLPALHYPAPPCSHTPDIHSLEQPFRHTRPQPILIMSTQTKPHMLISSKPSRSTL